MGHNVNRGFQPSFFRQGTVVDFEIPHALTSEISGTQRGIILSNTPYNRSSSQIIVCPILSGRVSADMPWGLSVTTKTQTIYMRPDLVRAVGYRFIKPVGFLNGQPLAWPMNLVQQAADKLIEIIEPTENKHKQNAAQSFLRYGQVGWYKYFPYIDTADVTPRALVACLTPPEIYTRTGTALLLRGYSHIENYHATTDVAVVTQMFGVRRFQASAIACLATDRLIAGSAQRRMTLNNQELRAIVKKLKGILSEAESEIVREKYKDMPAHVIASMQHKPHGGLRDHNWR